MDLEINNNKEPEGSDQDKVEVDYTLKKNLKKPPQQKPGFVIYHQNVILIK